MCRKIEEGTDTAETECKAESTLDSCNPDESNFDKSNQEVNAALESCGFGLFHIQLLFSSLVALVASLLTSHSTAFLLTSAECDLHMTFVQKGLLTAMPYIGMIVLSAGAGFLTDTFGRKKAIVYGLGACFVCNIISASSQTFEVLVFSKFCEGVGYSFYFTAVITLTSELCHEGIRDWILIWQSSYMAMAQVVIPPMAWAILPHDWNMSLFDGKFVLHTWNFYLYLMSLWTLFGCILYIILPESPKYLVSKRRYSEAREVIIKIYKVNTRKSADTFPIKDLWKKQVDSNVNDVDVRTDKRSIAVQIKMAMRDVKPLFHRPLSTHLVLMCIMNCFVMSIYNVFRLWYPQVSIIIESRGFTEDVHDLCVILDDYTSNLRELQHPSNMTECIPQTTGAETYINSMIIGCVCYIPYFVSGILVSKVGKKPLLLVAATFGFATIMALKYANSSFQVVSMFALTIAITQTLMSLNQVVILEYMPTDMRSLGFSLMMLMGRIGSLAGNILFPIMLKMGCSISFYKQAAMILCVVVLTIFLPTKKKM